MTPRPISTPKHWARIRACVLLALPLWLVGCATSTPVLMPALSAPGAEVRAQKDVKECSRLADQAVGRNGLSGGSLARSAGKAAGVSFAAAAVGSIVAKSSSAWERARGAAAGGAAGMASKLLLEWNEGDEVYQKYVEHCLNRRGHDVLGWR